MYPAVMLALKKSLEKRTVLVNFTHARTHTHLHLTYQQRCSNLCGVDKMIRDGSQIISRWIVAIAVDHETDISQNKLTILSND